MDGQTDESEFEVPNSASGGGPITNFRPKWANFDSFSAKIGQTGLFWEKRKCHFHTLIIILYYYAATLCKKPEQTYERILRSRMDGRTDKSEFVSPNALMQNFTLLFIIVAVVYN